MHAFSAAKRTALLALGLLFLIAVPQVQADSPKSGYLGVMLQDLSPSLAKALQLEGTTGVLINDVVADSPADKVGLEDGDVILMFNGEAVASTGEFTKAVRARAPGEEVEMVILHGGKKQTLRVELGANEEMLTWVGEGDGQVMMFKGQDGKDLQIKMLKDLHEDLDREHEIIIKEMLEDQDSDMAFFGKPDHGFLGVHLDDVTGQMASYFEVKGGALITEVTEDSPAAKAGLKAGDVIVAVDDEEIGNAADLHLAMRDTKPEQEVKVKVVRKGDDKTLKVTLGEMPEDMALGHVFFDSDGQDFTVTAPKMLFHGKGGPHGEYRVLRTAPGGEWTVRSGDLEDLRQELKAMKKELKELKKELKK